MSSQYGIMPDDSRARGAGADGAWGSAPSGNTYGLLPEAPGAGLAPQPATSADQPPPEVWERLKAAAQAWLGHHPGVVRLLAWGSRWGLRASLVVGLIAVLVVPRLLIALVPAFFMLACLGVLFLLGRTRTVSWRAVARMMALSTQWALVVALLTTVVGTWAGMRASDDGMRIALAAFLEEPGKLAPLFLLALVAPGRVRRMAMVDWALMGFACGAGFQIAEDFARRVIEPGLLGRLLGENRLSYSLNPWGAGSFSIPFSGPLGMLLGDRSTGVMVVGHQVSTMTVAMAIGFGVVLWRRRRKWLRALAWSPAALAFLVVVADHAAFNATASSVSWTSSGEGFPLLLELIWLGGGMGRAQAPLSFLMFLCCLVVDAHRRLVAGPGGQPGAQLWRLPPLTSLPYRLRLFTWALLAPLVLARADAVFVLAAYTNPLVGRAQRMVDGRLAARQALEARRVAMTRTTPGAEPASRHRFAWASLVLGLLALAATIGWSVYAGRAIGVSVTVDGDSLFFAGLLDSLADWWNSLGPGTQFLVGLLLALLLLTAGMSFGWGLFASGILTWAFAHGHGLADLLRDPAGSPGRYLATVGPAQLAVELLDLVLTFTPGGSGGKMAVRAAAGEAVARTGGRVVAQAAREGAPQAARQVSREAVPQGARQAVGEGTQRAARGAGREGVGQAAGGGGRGATGRGGRGGHGDYGGAAESADSQAPRRAAPEEKPEGHPLDGVDRGDGHDHKGKWAFQNEGAHAYEPSEWLGREQYRKRMARDGTPLREMISEKKMARVDGVPHGRYYDGIAQKQDGTWVGIEVKSGTGSHTKQQLTFDEAVSPNNPAHVTLSDGRQIKITEIHVEPVKKQGPITGTGQEGQIS